MLRKLSVVLFALFIFTHFTHKVYAVTVAITSYPTTINADSFNLNASISGAATGTNYVRVDVYKDTTQSYFGETYNGSDWYSGSDGKQYFPISVQSGTAWSGQIQARIGNPSISDYDGQGTYKLRIRRYTSSGGQGSEDANNSAVTVAINMPPPSPTPTPSPSPTPQNSPTPTPSAAPKSPSPTPTSTKLPTPTPKFSPEILGEQSSTSTPSASPSISPSPEPATNSTSTTKVAAILTGSGAIIIGLSAAFFLWYRRVLETKDGDTNKDN